VLISRGEIFLSPEFGAKFQSLIIASLSISISSGALMSRTCRLVHMCVCVWKVYCGKTADWIRMPFGLVSGIGLGMDILDFGGDSRRGRGSLGVNLGRPIVTSGSFATRSSQVAFEDLF